MVFGRTNVKALFAFTAACFASVVLATGSVGRADLYVQAYHANTQDRFYVGGDKAFIGQAYDWSGVGHALNRWGIMISPTYFVSAAHFPPVAGSSLTFYEDNTTDHPHSYAIDDTWSRINSDLYLGRLTAPISALDHITYYPILDLGSDSAYVGREIFVNGKPDRVGRNIITDIITDNVAGRLMEYAYDTSSPATVGDDEAYLAGFDSGGPSFTVVDGALALLGTHYGNQGAPPPTAGWLSADSFVPDSIAWLNSQMVAPNEHVTVVTPEPSTLVLLGVGAVGLLACARRRRR